MVTIGVFEETEDYNKVDYDGLWKKLIYELFEEFVLFFLPDLFEEIDFTREPDFLQQELFKEIMDEKKGRNVADQIIKVYLKSGDEKWLLIHIEVQGESEPDFSKRMFRYYYRIFDKYNRDIVAIAIFTNTTQMPHSNSYQRTTHGTTISYTYNTYHFSDHNDEELILSNNPFAIAVLAGKYANKTKQNEQKRFRFKRKIFQLALEKYDMKNEGNRILLAALFYFIDYLLKIPDELTSKLRNEITLTKEEIDLMYLDRKNPPPTLITYGEWKKELQEEWKKEVKQELQEEWKKEIKQELREELKEELRGEIEKEGLVEGFGDRELQKKIARKMLEEGLSKEVIERLTELSVEEIKRL
jgi:hypothetical protein